jgi:L-ascorbate metabolism protein UlaG (beta-lactamase superfamily)
MKITYLGHSGFLIECCEHSIVIDPFITGNPLAKHSIEDIKVQDILITHAHGDHLGDAIKIAKNNDATITAIFEIANYCAEQGAKTIGMNFGGKIKYKWGSAILTPATHSGQLPNGQYGGAAGAYVVDMCGNSIYHAGDTGLHYDMKMVKEVYSPELALLPIGDHFTMGIDDAVIAAHWLGVNHVIPMHYNTFPPIEADPEEFAKKIKSRLDIECTIMDPGTSKEIQSVCTKAKAKTKV